MLRKAIVCVALLVFVIGHPVIAAMTSTNYSISWDNVNAGGGDTSTSTNFGVLDTIGGNAVGTSTSANYGLSSGYRASEDRASLTFVVKSQESATQTAFTAFSNALKTVTVASAASFTVGQHIAVVEDVGFAEKVTVGKIVTIVGLDLTVDAWSGDQATISAVPAGGNDYVYRVEGSTIPFGTVTAATENVGVSMTSVLSSGGSGYTVYMHANQLLQNASANVMASVSDGTVSLGSEEYGFSTTGTKAVLFGSDYAVTTANQSIETSATPTSATPERVAIIHKLAITGSTTAGAYSQSVLYTATVNY